MTTGQLIKNARKRVGLTQKELGEKMGVSFQSIAQWENNLRKPKLETLQRIAAVLNVEPWKLMGDELAIEIPVSESFTESLEGKATASDETLRLAEILERHFVEIGLIKEGEDLSDEDTEFLLLIIRQLEMWFEKRDEQPSTTPQSPPAPPEGKDTTPPPDAPETASEGE